jgi:type II secretory pathway pseudopilin PulG
MSHKRSGITPIEVIVILAIIILMTALLLPAIREARESSKKSMCKLNLKLIGLAFHNYHDIYETFPPFVVWGGPAGEPLGEGKIPIGMIDPVALGMNTPENLDSVHANWAILLLPFLEQGNLFNQYRQELPISAPENKLVRAAHLTGFQCDIDPLNNADKFYNRDPNKKNGNFYARGNYAMNFGMNPFCITGLDENCEDGFQVDNTDLLNGTTQLWGTGAGGINKSFSIKDIKCGTPSLIIVEEIQAGLTSSDPRGAWALGFIGSSGTAGEKNFPSINASNSDQFIGCRKLKSKFRNMNCNPKTILLLKSIKAHRPEAYIRITKMMLSMSSWLMEQFAQFQLKLSP